MEHAEFNKDLLKFLNASPTPWHAVTTMKQQLDTAGFEELDKKTTGRLSRIAVITLLVTALLSWLFALALRMPRASGIRMVGAHTDSPCLKVKPNPELRRKGFFQLGVEVYGGVMMNPSFDRDLSLAGRVTFLDGHNKVSDTLVNFRKPVAFIPSLAIHLDREANTGRTVNPQTDLPPVLMQVAEGDATSFNDLLKQQITNESGTKVHKVLGYELGFYDAQEAGFVGLREEFIASARLDNLLSCYIGLQALLNTSGDEAALLVCNDHEEVGSVSSEGAQGPFLTAVLDRWCGAGKARAIARSTMISADNATRCAPELYGQAR